MDGSASSCVSAPLIIWFFICVYIWSYIGSALLLSINIFTFPASRNCVC